MTDYPTFTTAPKEPSPKPNYNLTHPTTANHMPPPKPPRPAATSTTLPQPRSLQIHVYRELMKCAATADEVASKLDRSILAIRPRCTELSHFGLAEDTGKRRRNATGRNAIVWRAIKKHITTHQAV